MRIITRHLLFAGIAGRRNGGRVLILGELDDGKEDEETEGAEGDENIFDGHWERTSAS